MNRLHSRCALIAAILVGCALVAPAQVRIVGDISGTVVDPSGAAVPNSKIVLKDLGTGIVKETSSNTNGQFTFPDLSFGKFEITVSASGFQTSILNDVTVEASKTTNVRATLQVGQQTQSITVDAESAPVLETTSNLTSELKDNKEFNELPILSRDALGVARLVPGATTSDGGEPRFNNMPGGSMNVTIDGINNASNGFKSGGTSFFGTAPGRLGAVEAVTVESSGLTADSAGMSGTNIKLVTRRGGSQYHGSLFYQPVSELFNANTWVRNSTGQGFRNRRRVHNYGGNFGGRLLPGTRLKDKLFFFVNLEMAYTPSQTASTRTVLNDAALDGTFYYQVGNTGNYLPINVLQIAGANGYPTAINPVISDMLAKQKAAQQYGYFTPLNNNFNERTLNWLDPRRQYDQFPTTRLDYYVSPNIQLTGTWTIQHQWVPGQHNWPGPDAPLQSPFRRGGYYIWSTGLNWTISPRTFNELRYGIQHSGDSNAASRPGYAALNTYNGAPMRVNSLPLNLSPYILENANTTGRHKILTTYDTATLIRGNHTITTGGQYRNTVWDDTAEFFQSPNFTIGVAGGDPLSSVFNATSMPGSNNNDFATAASLYALLVGRISAMSQTAQLNPKTFQYNGDIKYTWTAVHEGGVFVTDRWRVRPNLTANLGFRWEIQGDMYNPTGIVAFPDLNNLYGPSKGLFMPGVLSGNNDPVNYTHGHAFHPDWINPAPFLGLAWNPNRDGHDLLTRILGGNKTVLRASYGIVYFDEGTQMWATNAGNNPGQQFTSAAVINSTTPYNSYLFNYASGAIPAFPQYSSVIHQAQFTFNNTFNSMNPDLRAPYTINWNFGIQRQLRKNLVLEVRYVGNQSHHTWRTSTLNEVNIFENGFLDEFKNAQSNLKINQANGRGNTFQNNGLAGQVPLPIFDAAFGAIGSTAAVASGSGYASTGFITNLQNGAAGALAQSLATNSTYMCHMFGTNFLPCGSRLGYNAAGKYPINFFLTNPFSASGNLQYVDDKGWHNYNGLQVQLQKRYSRGLTFQSYYTFSKGLTNLPVSTQNQSLPWTTLRNQRLDRVPSGFDNRHVLQNIVTYDLPLGRNRLINFHYNWLNSLFGGWTLGNIVTIRSGGPVKLISGGNFNTFNNNDPGIMLAPGVTLDQIQSLMVNTQAANTSRYTVDKSLIAVDGRANPSIFLTPTTPGMMAYQLFLRNKNVFSWDSSVTKNFRLKERKNLALWLGATNVLNHPNWGLGTTGGSGNVPVMNIQSTTFSQTSGPSNAARSVQFRGTISF
jgi:hypothetical protein